jgi:hypothetical protein
MARAFLDACHRCARCGSQVDVDTLSKSRLLKFMPEDTRKKQILTRYR